MRSNKNKSRYGQLKGTLHFINSRDESYMVEEVIAELQVIMESSEEE